MTRLPENIYSVLSSEQGPDFLNNVDAREYLDLQNINKVTIRTGTRKGLFINSFLDTNLRLGGVSVPSEIVEPYWQEDNHKGDYLMPGMSAVLKAGVLPEGVFIQDGGLSISSDVSTSIDGQPIHKYTTTELAQVKLELKALLEQDHVVNVNSQVAGILGIKDQACGVVINPTISFTTSKLSDDEISGYFDSLNESQLRRSPGGILWPHPVIWNHINSIDGVAKDDPQFAAQQLDLLKSLLGVPTELRPLIEFLDKVGQYYTSSEANLFGLINLSDTGLMGERQRLEGSWHELIPNNQGELLLLRNARPADYVGMSDVATTNFREAPNYAYLRKPENHLLLEKYIAANTLSGIADLCSKETNILNLVVEDGRQIFGFRIVRKNGLIADGRRMHASLHQTNRGIGKILLSRSEQIAKQAGCETMEVHATGESYSWFERHGFLDHGIRPNTISDYHLMIKSL